MRLISWDKGTHENCLALNISRFTVCDWASEKGPSGHTKFDHLFQLHSIITKIYLRNWHEFSTTNENV